jgi:hypothetical protein
MLTTEDADLKNNSMNELETVIDMGISHPMNVEDYNISNENLGLQSGWLLVMEKFQNENVRNLKD